MVSEIQTSAVWNIWEVRAFRLSETDVQLQNDGRIGTVDWSNKQTKAENHQKYAISLQKFESNLKSSTRWNCSLRPSALLRFASL
jgi:hypothetical protein